VALGAAVFAGVIPSRSARAAIEIIMAGWRFGTREFYDFPFSWEFHHTH
jgi:hypothetical protein